MNTSPSPSLILTFEPDRAGAAALAAALEAPLAALDHHRFPDGESLVTAPAPLPPVVVLWCALHDPDARLMPLLLAADAARRAGARRLVLVAPYLPYMRQDTVFAPGQPVSAHVLGGLLGDAFDGVCTVDPHLHRVHHLDAILGAGRGLALSAAEAIGAALREHAPDALLLGPDEESRQWVEGVAAGRLDVQIGAKVRRGDLDVQIALPDKAALAGRRVVIVDDVASSGRTLARCARAAFEVNAASVDAVVTHAIFAGNALEVIADAGVGAVWSTDSVLHPTNRIPLAPLLASGLRGAGWLSPT